MKTKTIELTDSEITNLIAFFEYEFIPSIKGDDELDNMGYLCEMCGIYNKLKRALGGDADAD